MAWMTDLSHAVEDFDNNTDAKFVSMKEISGSVASVDWVTSKITVSGGSREMTLNVPDDTHVTRGDKDITLSDIEISDQVRIEYLEDAASGTLNARRITDMNTANE